MNVLINDESIFSDLRFDVPGQLRLPSVTVCQQFLLVVEQFLMSNGGVLVIGALDNGINRASFLAEAAIDTFCHVDVVSSSSSGTIGSGLTFDGDGISRTGSGAKFAGNASV